MEDQNESHSDFLRTSEEIAVEYADALDLMIRLNKRVISELAQYRRMDAEEKELQALADKIGGVKTERLATGKEVDADG